MARPDFRRNDEMRKVKMITGYTMYAEGSVLMEIGKTKVLCNATIENEVLPLQEGTGNGWVTAEYSMIPRATANRRQREISSQDAEIQRLIGRSLRAVTDLKGLDERLVIVDCDVLQDDGGAVCAAITGGFAALYLALHKFIEDGKLKRIPLRSQVSAISTGIYKNEPILDLNAEENLEIQASCNLVMTGEGEIVEIQGVGEGHPFSKAELGKMLSLGKKGTAKLCREQKKVTGELR